MAVSPPPTILSDTFRQSLCSTKLCRPGDCLIIGVSGGADSIALLDLLATLPDFPLHLIVAHLNHCLRGAESDADMTFVRQRAAVYGLTCEVRTVAIQESAAANGYSLEEAGRIARYNFFEELRRQYQATAIAVAHHRDDQAETLLLRLLRGAGTTGLGAMPLCNRLQIIRPLLGFSRDDIRNHLTTRGLTFREDQSNCDQNYLRNRIRHQLLPLLATYNPAIGERLAATAQLLQEDEALLADYTASCYQEMVTTGPGWVSLPRKQLSALRTGLRTRLYRLAIEQLTGNLRRIERKHLQQLDDCLCSESTGSSRNLPNLLVGLLTADNLLIGLEQCLFPAPPGILTINGCGTVKLGNGLSLRIEPATPPVSWNSLPPTTTYVDLLQAPLPWQLRPFRPGERMEPLGMTASRRIQDILTDKKVPRNLRPALPLLCCADQTIWLAGACRSRHALLTPDSSDILKISLLGTEILPFLPYATR